MRHHAAQSSRHGGAGEPGSPATGGSAIQALNVIKEAGATDLRLVTIVSSPEGVAALESAHPDVPLVTAAIDRELNAQSYIMPGLGDFGDRLYGT